MPKKSLSDPMVFARLLGLKQVVEERKQELEQARRELMEEARRLHASGATLAEIAKRLDVHLQTVFGWVHGKGRGR